MKNVITFEEKSSKDAQRVISQISAMAMVDDEFKNRLVADPASVLEEYGLKVPSGTKIEIRKSFEGTAAEWNSDTIYIVIPQADELSHEDLLMPNRPSASCC